jgi:hypothetical protein
MGSEAVVATLQAWYSLVKRFRHGGALDGLSRWSPAALSRYTVATSRPEELLAFAIGPQFRGALLFEFSTAM